MPLGKRKKRSSSPPTVAKRRSAKKKVKKTKGRKVVVARHPFPLESTRRLTFAFRTTVTPPDTNSGGFSLDSYLLLANSCFDPDKSNLVAGTIGSSSSRINHQPMGFDQIMQIYNKYLVTSSKLDVKFAFEHPTTYHHGNTLVGGDRTQTVVESRFSSDNTPCRCGVVLSDADDLPVSLMSGTQNVVTFEKLIELAKSGMLPKGSQFKYKTLMKQGHVGVKMNIDPYKFAKAKAGTTWPEYKAANSHLKNQEPGVNLGSNPVYAHCFVSPLSCTSGDSHAPVVVYGTLEMDVLFSDLHDLVQS